MRERIWIHIGMDSCHQSLRGEKGEGEGKGGLREVFGCCNITIFYTRVWMNGPAAPTTNPTFHEMMILAPPPFFLENVR